MKDSAFVCVCVCVAVKEFGVHVARYVIGEMVGGTTMDSFLHDGECEAPALSHLYLQRNLHPSAIDGTG